MGLPKNLAATDTGNAGNINENVGEKLTVTVTLTTTITTNGVTFQMKSVQSLCTGGDMPKHSNFYTDKSL